MSDRRGFALIAALWLLVAFSAIGLEFALAARDQRLAASNAVEGTVALAAADAGAASIHSMLTQRIEHSRRGNPEDTRFLLDPWGGLESQPVDTVYLGDARYAVVLHDLGGRLNLNRASEDELRRFFRALRVDFGQADRLAQAIRDWTDRDDLHRARGAEREDYLARGAPQLPSDGPFQDLGELRFVKGMTSELYRTVGPYLTIRGTGLLNLNAAARPVLLSLGFTAQAVEAIERHQTSGRPLRNLEELALELPPNDREALQQQYLALAPKIVFDTREIEARSSGWIDGSPVRARVTALFVRSADVTFMIWKKAD